MDKPKITVYSSEGKFIYVCPLVDEKYRYPIRTLEGIFNILKILWMLEKDERGMYIHATNYPLYDTQLN
jgi:hypothetical protein